MSFSRGVFVGTNAGLDHKIYISFQNSFQADHQLYIKNFHKNINAVKSAYNNFINIIILNINSGFNGFSDGIFSFVHTVS